MSDFHTPVLLKETIDNLKIKRGGQYIDATIGGGGHAAAILKLKGKILGIDYDPEAIKAARKHLASACPAPIKSGIDTSWRLARGNFKDLREIAENNGFSGVDGILFDLGVSSYQLETPGRGFSFNDSGPLDMRMNPGSAVTAADLVNGLNQDELEELFRKYSQERYAGKIAEAIVRARKLKPIKTCDQLAEIIVRARSKKGRFDRLHPATRVFQALRIAVNDELNNLRAALPQAVEILNPAGRLAVISFHSGEDRIVKNFFKDKEREGKIKIITKKPILAQDSEVAVNPKSRSAKLRIGEKI